MLHNAPLANASGAVAPAGKIKTPEDLRASCDAARGRGDIIAHCHGVFDLFHPGHLRHLQEAKRHGNFLVVTLTADRFVNKGPGRPVFNAQLRAEMLAALEIVDAVCINDQSSAEPIIDIVRPHFYVKGPDYAKTDDDITGKIKSERDTVEKWGGRLLITDDITFSSSALINNNLDVFTQEQRAFLATLKANNSLVNLKKFLETIAGYRVVVVGDAIIDEYIYARPMNKPPKENMIAVQRLGQELFFGGVIATANHLAGFVREVEIITSFGTQDNFAEQVLQHLQPNVKISSVRRPGAPSTLKTRYVDKERTQKLFEVYNFDDSSLPDELDQQFAEQYKQSLSGADLVVVNDFGHGLISDRSIRLITDTAPYLAVNAQTNSANFGFNLITRYPKADYICVDEREARLAISDRQRPLAQCISDGLALGIHCPKFIVTQGKYGCLTYEAAGKNTIHVPAFAGSVVDTMGAGDAFLAITAPLMAAGADPALVGFAGNIVGAIKAGIVGHRTSVDKVSFIKAITMLSK